MKTVLSLFDYTGNWSKPYRDAGYEVVQVDLQRGDGDARLLKHLGRPVHGILAAPPCTKFAVSGARWKRSEAEMVEALSMVDVVARCVVLYRPKWWVFENPVGTLIRWWGPPRVYFNPCDFGGYLSPPGDRYTKKTGLWGDFNVPEKRPVEPTEGSKMHLLPPSPERANLRSATPMGFARAFFEANP